MSGVDQADLGAVARDREPPVVETGRRVDPWPAAAFADLARVSARPSTPVPRPRSR